VRAIAILMEGILFPLTFLFSYAAFGNVFYREKIISNCATGETYNEFVSPAYYEYHFILLGVIAMLIALYHLKKRISLLE